MCRITVGFCLFVIIKVVGNEFVDKNINKYIYLISLIYYFYGKIAQAGIKISLTGVFRSGLFFIPILSM